MKKEKELYEIVDDGIGYFLDMGFIEELTTDKRYYVNKFIAYIYELEEKNRLIKNKTEKATDEQILSAFNKITNLKIT